MGVLKTDWQLLRFQMIERIVFDIESRLPGWWYSIYQEADTFRLVLGPSYACPDAASRYLMSTFKPGHEEFSVTSQNDVSFIDDAISLIHQLKSDLHHVFEKEPGGYILQRTDTCRKHIPTDLSLLKHEYTRLLDYILTENIKVKDTPVDQIYQLTQISLGSCQVTADCSIYLTLPNDKKIELRCDLDEKLDSSLRTCIDDLKAIVTHNLSCTESEEDL